MNISNLSDEELLQQCSTSVEAQEALIRRYTKTVRACARRFYLLGGDDDDLVQEGMIGLLNAIREYCPENGTFPAFAVRCINNRLVSAVRAASAKKHAPLNESVSIISDTPDFPLPEAVAESPEELLINKERYSEYLTQLYKQLSAFEQRILDAYLDGMTISEIADSIRKPQKSVANAVQRIKAKAYGILTRR